ncbi:MAG: helix-turn-helix transcriptional regulator [Candidatus Nanopelagicales bacterium]|nr:helix-turn-helix transcriptional regulator [Candidatus Nanopelagicales bacterium]MDZ4249106.1 helix-turn-helix transcriptional regulator [Candidatus Nanopelagicales bacterium]MDZ7578501.1 helix-turn-helix transcriptional regulator [Candidatus Nanopelagicales bacterium]
MGNHLIAEMRIAAGLSQAELARRSGIPRTVINAYERGRREPGATALARLAEACGQRLTVVPRRRLNLARNARVLAEVLDLAERLPRRRRGELAYPPLPARAGHP